MKEELLQVLAAIKLAEMHYNEACEADDWVAQVITPDTLHEFRDMVVDYLSAITELTA